VAGVEALGRGAHRQRAQVVGEHAREGVGHAGIVEIAVEHAVRDPSQGVHAASVRPAPRTGTRRSPFRRASAASSTPCTVRWPGWSCQPAKSVPS
jgi:hypothetical protein